MNFAAIRRTARGAFQPIGGGLLSVSLLFSSIALVASLPASAEDAAQKPYVIMIHADWCGTCKAVAPVWEQIQADLADETTVVTLDVTDRPAYTASREAARELGIAEFFNTYRAKTGTIAVLACGTREPVAVLSGERDFEAYRTAVTEAACKAS